MTIETKYDIGQKVYTVIGQKIRCLTIERIDCYHTDNITHNKYGFSPNPYIGTYDSIEEKDLFPTKEELLNSL
jgi:hypothetical protein